MGNSSGVRPFTAIYRGADRSLAVNVKVIRTRSPPLFSVSLPTSNSLQTDGLLFVKLIIFHSQYPVLFEALSNTKRVVSAVDKTKLGLAG